MDLKDILREIEQDMLPETGNAFVDVAARYFAQSRNAERPVSTRLDPAALAARFDDSPPDEPTPLEVILQRLEDDVVAHSNWLYHPRYMGHQVTAPLPAPVWTDALIGALNQSVAVQEMSPAITMIERNIIRWMTGLIGWGPDAGGTLTSGGTEATFTALLAARALAIPDAWQNGVGDNPPVIICGEHAHYAVTRATAELGLGLKRAIAVKSIDFRMDPNSLRMKIEECGGRGSVMAVVATAGSTATGSFDDLDAVADVCDEYGIWLHVDGAHGASALLSPGRKSLVTGLGRARSVAWDPHKMMVMPLSVGVVLVRDQNELAAAFSQKAPYLFAKESVSWDQGGRSFQCSRRADALKLWVGLHRYGTRAFGLLFDHFCDLTRYLYELLERHSRFEVLHEPECNILCFRYRGTDELNARIRAEYNTAGTGWITTTVLGDRRVLRTTLINPRITRHDIDEAVAELDAIGRRLGQK